MILAIMKMMSAMKTGTIWSTFILVVMTMSHVPFSLGLSFNGRLNSDNDIGFQLCITDRVMFCYCTMKGTKVPSARYAHVLNSQV